LRTVSRQKRTAAAGQPAQQSAAADAADVIQLLNTSLHHSTDQSDTTSQDKESQRRQATMKSPMYRQLNSSHRQTDRQTDRRSPYDLGIVRMQPSMTVDASTDRYWTLLHLNSTTFICCGFLEQQIVHCMNAC